MCGGALVPWRKSVRIWGARMLVPICAKARGRTRERVGNVRTNLARKTCAVPHNHWTNTMCTNGTRALWCMPVRMVQLKRIAERACVCDRFWGSRWLCEEILCAFLYAHTCSHTRFEIGKQKLDNSPWGSMHFSVSHTIWTDTLSFLSSFPLLKSFFFNICLYSCNKICFLRFYI